MPNTTIGHYDIYRAMGRSPEEAARMVGADEDVAGNLEAAYSKPGAGPSMLEALDTAALMDQNSPYSVEEAMRAIAYSGQTANIDTLYPEGVHNVKRPWYKPIIEGAMVVGETLAVPQQLMWQGLMSANGGEGEWRQAIPDWAAPDDWKKQGVEHKFVDVGDVIDDYIGGKYHTLLQGLDDNGGIAKYGAGWGLKTAEFVTDVILDPMNIIAGAGIGKHLWKGMRATLPTEVQARMAGKAALKSRQLVDLEEAAKLQTKWVDELEAKALTEPSEQVGKHLALAKSRQQFIEDEIAYMKTVANSEGITIELPPVNKTAKVDKPQRADFDTEEEFTEAAAKYAAQQQLGKVYVEPLAYADLDRETLLRRIATGPDDVEVLSAAIRKILKGEDPNSILIRGILDNVAPTSTSLEIAITGIGKNGMVTRELASSVELMGEIAELRKTGIVQSLKAREALKIARKEAVEAATPRNVVEDIAAGEALVADIFRKSEGR